MIAWYVAMIGVALVAQPLPEFLKSKEVFVGEVVCVRGFLGLNLKKQVILTSIPNIRSCCAESDDAGLILEGDFPEKLPKGAVDIQGILKKKEKWVIEKAVIK